jgi:glutathione synthase/RimK-type ligase-like ATP-grasp enzyme
MIRSKLLKTTVLLKDRTFKQYVPETRHFSSDNLIVMLRAYRMVYVKPDRGRYGHGVMKVEMLSGLESSSYRLYFGSVAREYTSYDECLAAVDYLMASRSYIVQQGIRMLTHDGNPFDIRIMVQKSRLRCWETTGYLAKVAAPHQIVTNFHSGGTPQELIPLLSCHMTTNEAILYVSRLCHLGEMVALHYYRSFPDLTEVGLDIAIDRDLRPWILEVNTRPLADLFKKLKDQTMYTTMCRYARLNGRYRSARLARPKST